jgi:transcriptional regulator with XRE-family HTH domain
MAQSWEEQMRSDLPSKGKTFPERTGTATQVSRSVFRRQLSAALARRLHPNTPLTRKALARAIGRTPETIENYLSGYSQPDAHVMGTLMAALGPAFANEVYGPQGLIVARAEDARRACVLLQRIGITGQALADLERLIAAADPPG